MGGDWRRRQAAAAARARRPLGTWHAACDSYPSCRAACSSGEARREPERSRPLAPRRQLPPTGWLLLHAANRAEIDILQLQAKTTAGAGFFRQGPEQVERSGCRDVGNGAKQLSTEHRPLAHWTVCRSSPAGATRASPAPVYQRPARPTIPVHLCHICQAMAGCNSRLHASWLYHCSVTRAGRPGGLQSEPPLRRAARPGPLRRPPPVLPAAVSAAGGGAARRSGWACGLADRPGCQRSPPAGLKRGGGNMSGREWPRLPTLGC